MTSDPRHTSETDASNDKPEPANAKKKIVKSQPLSHREMAARFLGKLDPTKKTSVIVNPDIQNAPHYQQQAIMAERFNLGDLKMIKNTYASLIQEVDVPTTISESSRSFLELAAYDAGVEYEDLEDVFMEGMKYGVLSEDTERSPEDYGIYYVNTALVEFFRGRTGLGAEYDHRDREAERDRDVEARAGKKARKGLVNTLSGLFKFRTREKIKKEKETSTRYRSQDDYAPEVSGGGEDDTEPKRYIVTIDDKPGGRGEGHINSYKIRAFNDQQAHLFALDRHRVFLGGKLPKKIDHWDINVRSDRSAVGPEGLTIAKRRKKRTPKPTTGIGKAAHWLGKVAQERSEAPKPKPKRGGGGSRKRVPVQRDAIPPTHQLEYHPRGHEDDED